MLTFEQNKLVTEIMQFKSHLWLDIVKSNFPMDPAMLAELVSSEAARRAETADKAGTFCTPANMLLGVMDDLNLMFVHVEDD